MGWLLLAALAPMVMLGLINSRGISELARDISRHFSSLLEHQARQRLLHSITYTSNLIRDKGTAFELAFQLQQKLVEEALATPVAPDAPLPQVYFEEDFNSSVPPPGTAPSPIHKALYPDGTIRPMAVSFQHPVFYLFGGATRESVREEAIRLNLIRNDFRQFFDSFSGNFFWQYTTLEKGLHISFPGKGGYPEGYDPRTRPWYKAALKSDSYTWTPLTVDAVSGRLVLTLAGPVHWPDGTVAGVTAFDVLADYVLDNETVPDLWPESYHFLAHLSDKRSDALQVLISQDMKGKPLPWQDPVETQWLTSKDSAAFAAILSDIKAGKTSTRRCSYRDTDCLWSYGPVSKGTFLVYVVPYKAVIADAIQSQKFIETEFYKRFRNALIAFSVILVLVALLAFIASLPITQPVTRLVNAVRRVGKGDLDAKVSICSRDEIEELGEAFNQMVPQLKDSFKIKESLALANEVQQHLLPSEPPSLEGFDIAGKVHYCDETGGDYYDFIKRTYREHDQLAIIISDVTGHGIAPALLMATGRAHIRSALEQLSSLSAIVEHVNSRLCTDTSKGRFMTAFFLLIDPRLHTLEWASAGHDPAIFYNASEDSFSELSGAGLPLGIVDGPPYSTFSQKGMQQGDIIVMGTDGIWEARNTQGDMFGKDRLRKCIEKHASLTAAGIASKVVLEIERFRGKAPQTDDITLIVVKKESD